MFLHGTLLIKDMPSWFKIQSGVLLLFVALTTVGCRDNNNAIPLVAVDREINITLPSYSSLSVVGGWAYVTGGSKGLLIYRRTLDQFVAYDRHVPYDVDLGCIVEVDQNNVECVDPCSQSRFSLYDGSPLDGPATFPLKQYSATFNGTIVHVYN